jgi:hypothetical protein
MHSMKSTGKPNKKRSSQADSFLEAFRDLGSEIVSTTKDNFKAGARDLKDSILPFGGTDQYPEGGYNPQFGQAELERKHHSQLRRMETIRREEKVLFNRQEKLTQDQVKNLQEEIKGLAKSVGKLASEAKEAEIAALQEPTVVGTYHLNFFARLSQFIAKLKAEIQESSFWLESWNKRAQKKNHYWKQVKKSGSKFLLSSDRYMATQAG